MQTQWVLYVTWQNAVELARSTTPNRQYVYTDEETARKDYKTADLHNAVEYTQLVEETV